MYDLHISSSTLNIGFDHFSKSNFISKLMLFSLFKYLIHDINHFFKQQILNPKSTYATYVVQTPDLSQMRGHSYRLSQCHLVHDIDHIRVDIQLTNDQIPPYMVELGKL